MEVKLVHAEAETGAVACFLELCRKLAGGAPASPVAPSVQKENGPLPDH
jgi:hypothetical protein